MDAGGFRVERVKKVIVLVRVLVIAVVLICDMVRMGIRNIITGLIMYTSPSYLVMSMSGKKEHRVWEF
jgi:hypothetical protein